MDTPLIVAAKVEEERAKWESAQTKALEAQRVALTSDTEFMKPIVEAITRNVENVYSGKLGLVESNYTREIELMKKKNDSEIKALLEGFEVKLNFERKMQNLRSNAQ